MLLDLSISQLNQKLQNGECSAVDIINEVIKGLESVEPKLHSFIYQRPKDELLEQAKEIDKNKHFKTQPLAGIPYILKDSYVTSDMPTTAGSKVLKDVVSPYDATVYARLKKAGAICIGKSSMDAWGHGATSENTDFPVVKNPHEPTRSAGGSTGGVAAAIAARLVSFGIGEDTGGSIRNPSAWNGITGLKVSYGRVSRYGCIAYASSFDTVGPMAKSAADCELVLQAIAGHDPYDATSATNPFKTNSTNSSLTIGIPKELFTEALHPEINQALMDAKELLKEQGHTIKEVSMPTLMHALPIYYLIGPSETSSNLGRYDGIRYGQSRSYFTPETTRRIMLGTYALSAGYYDAFYKKALQARTVLINEYKKTFQTVDALLMPTTPTHAPKLGELMDDPITNMMADIYTITHNIAGIPSLAFPVGYSSTNLPIGAQLASPMFTEHQLFNVVSRFQESTTWHTKHPKITNS